MANGLKKNLQVVQHEIADWRALMPQHIRALRDANGIGGKLHKAVNLVTESVRLLPRTLTYSLLIFVVLDGALHTYFWLR